MRKRDIILTKLMMDLTVGKKSGTDCPLIVSGKYIDLIVVTPALGTSRMVLRSRIRTTGMDLDVTE